MNNAVEQQKTFEGLAGAVTLQGWRDFDVAMAFDQLIIDRNGGRVASTVIMLPNGFLARFAFPAKFADPIFFSIEKGAHSAGRDATRRFSSADEAARWLLEFLETD
jgi:hypothetical protein